MPSIVDDISHLHNDCNPVQTLVSLPNITLFPSYLENLLKDDCLCTLKEVIFQLKLENIDITQCSQESQVKFLTRLVSERFHSTCFSDTCSICIRCSLSPDLEISISDVDQLQECASRLLKKASQIPHNEKLHLACLTKDHKGIEDLLEEAQTTDPKEKNMFIFYGISCGEIVDIFIKRGFDVNARDARRRTPLFYALISSLKSAEKLLDQGASVFAKDKRNVSVLTFFAENILKNHMPADVKVQGIKLLHERKIQRDQMIDEVKDFILCKFIQVLARRGNDVDMLCETLRMFLELTREGTQGDDHDNLISQLRTIQESIDSDNFEVSDMLQPFFGLEKKSLAPDSEGNTSLHYATQLQFYGVSEKKVTELCCKLLDHDANSKDAKNHKKETPLLFCLSSKDLMFCSDTSNWSGCLQAVCSLLMNAGAELCDTTHKEETAFQLILKHFQYAILLQGDDDDNRRSCIFQEMFKILELFSSNDKSSNAVNNGDIHLNTPLHLWASMAMKSPSHYSANVHDDVSFKDLLAKILQQLKTCGVKLNDGNENDETPLHVCRTWTAVKLLLDAGAKPDVTDSSGCTPLLAAAKRNTCIEKDSEFFYPDVRQTPKEFWKEALNKKLDPWSADKDGNSVLSILLQKEANCLAKALIEVACEQQHVQSDEVGVPLLIAVCKDQSSENHWKLNLVKLLVDSKRSLVRCTTGGNNDTPLHFSCRNILEQPGPSIQDCVHWHIAQHLLLHGADRESCLALSDNYPPLRDLLSTQVDHSTLTRVREWEQSSQSHSQKLSLVARMVKCRQVGSLYLYQKALDEDKSTGNFVFAGILQGGREVAAKRIDKSKMSSGYDLESVCVLRGQCQQIVQYLSSVEDGNFRYVAFELMEGALEHYLDEAFHADDSIKLFKDLVMGLQFLENQGIVHGNISPRTVFYHTKPNLCLKIGNSRTSSSRRGWVAAEVLEGEMPSPKSDVFSCGLVLHYLLSGKRHPFAPVDSTTRTHEQVLQEKEGNIRNGNIVKIDDSLSPEATDLVRIMLDKDPNNRPSASETLIHPFFWDNERKKRFLKVVGNEPEIANRKRQDPLTAFQTELQGRFNVIVTRGTTWNASPQYDNIRDTLKEMKGDYDYEYVPALIRFIRNAYVHLNEQPRRIQQVWEGDFVLNDYFPHLVIEVYKALTRSEFHQLHESSTEIKTFFEELKRNNCE